MRPPSKAARRALHMAAYNAGLSWRRDPRLAYASARRAEVFSALNRLHIVLKHGPVPFDLLLRSTELDNLRAANRSAWRVLP